MKTLIALLALAVASVAAASVAPANDMAAPRAAHTATLLRSGEVLIAGGCTADGCELDERSATTEIYDPRTGRFRGGPRLSRPRVGHAAVPLPDGSVLVVGGWDGKRPTASAELFDPEREAFAPLQPMSSARGGFSATVLAGGRVLIAGGTDGNRMLRTAEIFDPQVRRFVPTGSMRAPRAAHAATGLGGGRALITGGSAAGRLLASAEVYDGRTGRFSPAGRMTIARHKHAAIALSGGAALVVGGSDAQDFRGRHSTAEVFDARSRRFTRVASMRAGRFKLPDAVVRLRSGHVLVAGDGERLEIYDPKRRRFRFAGETGVALAFATATLLGDGRVLLAGGYDHDLAVTRRSWIFSS